MDGAPEAPRAVGIVLSLVMCCFRKAAGQLKSRKVWKHRSQLFGEPNTSERGQQGQRTQTVEARDGNAGCGSAGRLSLGSGLLEVQKGRGGGRAGIALPWQVGQQCPDGMSGWLQPRGSQGLRPQVTKPSRQVHRLQGARGSGNSWPLR